MGRGKLQYPGWNITEVPIVGVMQCFLTAGSFAPQGTFEDAWIHF